jgi:hypothetical protein
MQFFDLANPQVATVSFFRNHGCDLPLDMKEFNCSIELV